MRVASLLLCLLCGAACAPAGDDAPVVLFGGARYDWQAASHPFSWLRAGIGDVAADGRFVAELGIEGEDDVPTWELSWLDVRSERVTSRQGEVSFSLQEEPYVTVPVVFSLDDTGLQDWSQVAVALRSFTIDGREPLADGAPGGHDPLQGWAIAGLGVGLSSPTRGARELFFDVTVHVDPAARDGSAMSANAEFAAVTGTVGFTVLGARAATLASGALTGSDHVFSDGDWAVVGPLPVEERTMGINGLPRYHLGIPLLRGWNLTLAPDAPAGRYLRAVGVRLETHAYDWVRGRAATTWEVTCSHSSADEAGDLAYDFAIEADLLQVDDVDGSVVLDRASAPSEVGPIEVSLP